jgi:hypothetical protein
MGNDFTNNKRFGAEGAFFACSGAMWVFLTRSLPTRPNPLYKILYPLATGLIEKQIQKAVKSLITVWNMSRVKVGTDSAESRSKD